MKESLPWIGFLNEMLNELEKFRGRSFFGKKLFLKKFMSKVTRLDSRFLGQKFTWKNRQERVKLIKERINRVVACLNWIEIFPEAEVHHLTMESLDHTPILLQTASQILKGRRSFRLSKHEHMTSGVEKLLKMHGRISLKAVWKGQS